MSAGADDKPTPDFTMQELAKAIGVQVPRNDPNAATIAEMAEAWGLDRSTVRKYVNEAVGNGTVVAVPVYRVSSDGRRYPTTGYKVFVQKGAEDEDEKG